MDGKINNEFMAGIRADLEKTLATYRNVAALRARKMDQDLEQIGVYLKIIEEQAESIKINSYATRRIQRLLSWKPRDSQSKNAYRRQQDQLEDHFLELQKLLVGLISKKFKY